LQSTALKTERRLIDVITAYELIRDTSLRQTHTLPYHFFTFVKDRITSIGIAENSSNFFAKTS